MAASKSASAAPHAVPVSVSTPRVSNRRLAIAPVRFISADAAVAELLRTLQSGEYSPIGSSETRFRHVRVIAAANRERNFHERLKRCEINARSFRAAAAARK